VPLAELVIELIAAAGDEGGITISLAQPEECPAEQYYVHRLPGPNGLIEKHRAWAQRMGLVVANLEQAMRRTFAPARQLGLARFLDAALRGVVLRESSETTEAFRLWSRDVQPMLWFEWRRLLDRKGLAAADVFTRHTPAMPPEALRGLDEAYLLDKTFTEAWRAACADDDLARALRRLFQGLPRAQQVCGPQEYAVLLFRQAIECARLARRLDESAGKIPDSREARDTILAWTGQALEELLTGPLAGRIGGDVFAIMEVLTGREAPRYGRVVSS
jgi:hypothetical protein